MKIGILTFHYGNNYGGILQCYALQNVLSGMGHYVEIINYEPSPISLVRKIGNKVKTLYTLEDIVKNIKEFYAATKDKSVVISENVNDSKQNILAKFDAFRTAYIHLSQEVNEKTIGSFVHKYDAIIVGSDQVWSSLFDKQSVYFLEFEPAFRGKRISYAACSAYNVVSKTRAVYLEKYLSKFDSISVRDEHTAALVKSITAKEPAIVADPTLLYDFKEFVNKKESEPYILTYIIGPEIQGGHQEAIQKIKIKYGDLKVVSIVIPGHAKTIEKLSDKVYYDASPIQWINLITNASFVYTDSFHGIIFSMKFQKNFLAYYSSIIRASRLLDMKKRFNLDTYIVSSTDEIALINSINYNYIELYLESFSDESLKYLREKIG